MATTTIDPRKPGQYTLKIGKGLKSGSGSASSSYSKVKFNHKPSLSTGSRTVKISRKEDGTASLSINDNENGHRGRYSYKGRTSSSKTSYVLLFDHAAQSCTLEPVQTSYNFNLTSTPWETDKDKLAKDYDQLSLEEIGSDPVNVDLDPDEEPDKDNPYDFRHYLNLNSRASPSPSPALRPTSTSQNLDQEPTRPRAISAASKPQARSTPKVDPLRQAPRKQKPTTTSSSKDTKTAARPAIRLERKASALPGDPAPKKTAAPSSRTNVKSDYYVHSSDDEDSPPLPSSKPIDVEESGGLEIDWGNDRPKPRQQAQRATAAASAASLDLPGDFADGPISLHSAANSPAGRIISRKQKKKRQDYEADVIDFGTSDINDDESSSPAPPEQATGEEEEEEEAEEEDTQMGDVPSDHDTDVEPMQLGSPAHHKVSAMPEQMEVVQENADGVGPSGVEDEVDYDDDDLEAEMMKAMEEDVVGEVEDESDVSEAE